MWESREILCSGLSNSQRLLFRVDRVEVDLFVSRRCYIQRIRTPALRCLSKSGPASARSEDSLELSAVSGACPFALAYRSTCWIPFVFTARMSALSRLGFRCKNVASER